MGGSLSVLAEEPGSNGYTGETTEGFDPSSVDSRSPTVRVLPQKRIESLDALRKHLISDPSEANGELFYDALRRVLFHCVQPSAEHTATSSYATAIDQWLDAVVKVVDC